MQSKENVPMSNHHATQLTRRQFLIRGATAAGAVAASWLIPASALGRGGTVAPSERIIMGGIGLGGRGSYDMGVMLAQKDVQWVAVCDVAKGQREAARKQSMPNTATRIAPRIAICASSWPSGRMLDAVLIATGDRWHALASVWAMQAGKDVFCEKPSCLTMAQGQMVVDQ